MRKTSKKHADPFDLFGRRKMICPKLGSLESADLCAPALPLDTKNCSIPFSATIGPDGRDGGDIFYFTLVTAEFLYSARRTQWGRGLLIVPEFSWETVHGALRRLLIRAIKPSWAEVAVELNKVLCWEFDGYDRKSASP